MRLSELLDFTGDPILPKFQISRMPDSDTEIRQIAYRSDRIEPGDLFVAIRGQVADGHDFIADALTRGAAAIVAERPVPDTGASVVVVDDSRMALSALSAKIHGFPGATLTLVGVTGTNGKTTTARIIESVLTEAGHPTGGIGTIDWHFGELVGPAPNTTPESADLQAILATMRDAGATHAVMEVSSHAIDLGRISHCRFAAAAFTNLSQDHLDWHGDMATYWQSKKGFLESVLESGGPEARIVLNIDDAYGKSLLNECLDREGDARLVSVGQHPDALIRPGGSRFSLDGIRTTVSLPDATFLLESPLAGLFNLENLLCAAGVGHGLGIDSDTLQRGLSAFSAVPGRMERLTDEAGRHVFIDYAHTPDALEKVLRTIRELTDQRVISVFGCGGDRDRTKRPLMGKIATELADLAVITSDNPRTEDPDLIIADVVAGISESVHHLVIADREAAIHAAIAEARPGDAVVITGKGHEPYQIVGPIILDFNDIDVARKGLLHRA